MTNLHFVLTNQCIGLIDSVPTKAYIGVTRSYIGPKCIAKLHKYQAFLIHEGITKYLRAQIGLHKTSLYTRSRIMRKVKNINGSTASGDSFNHA